MSVDVDGPQLRFVRLIDHLRVAGAACALKCAVECRLLALLIVVWIRFALLANFALHAALRLLLVIVIKANGHRLILVNIHILKLINVNQFA